MQKFTSFLSAAQKGSYGICSFNVYNYETILGVILAACEANAPVIVALGQNYLHQMSCKSAAALVSSLAQEHGAQAALHLDHCRNKELIYRAIDAGFDSVMFDGSALRFEENLAATAEIAAYAHSAGAAIEAELGSLAAGVGSNEAHLGDREMYTDPEAAAEFVKHTGADALAVSIGTVHGFYKAAPNIRVDILEAITQKCSAPLVLHGGSGTPEEKLLACLQHGIAKVNINTELSAFAVDGIKRYLLQNEGPHLAQLSQEMTGLVREIAGRYIRLLGRGLF